MGNSRVELCYRNGGIDEVWGGVLWVIDRKEVEEGVGIWLVHCLMDALIDLE